MRFLTLVPHCGEADSLITCALSTEPLMECEPYTAVVNTRGNPFHHVIININGMGMSIPWNILLFLGHIRSESEFKRLWFRDVCLNHIDKEERAQYWNSKWMKTMSSHAADIVDLSEVIAGLWDQGKVEPPFHPRPKGRFRPRDHNFNMHTPIQIDMQHNFEWGYQVC